MVADDMEGIDIFLWKACMDIQRKGLLLQWKQQSVRSYVVGATMATLLFIAIALTIGAWLLGPRR